MSTKTINILVFLFIYLIGLPSVIAQGGPPPPGDPPVIASIDSNIYLLMAAGVLFALYIFTKKTNALKKVFSSAEKIIFKLKTKLLWT